MNTIQPNREIVWSTGVIALAVMAMAAAGSGLVAYVPVQLDKPTIASTQSAATPAMSGMRVPKMENTRAVPKPESKAAVQPVSATVPQASAKPAPAANPAPAGQQAVRLEMNIGHPRIPCIGNSSCLPGRNSLPSGGARPSVQLPITRILSTWLSCWA